TSLAADRSEKEATRWRIVARFGTAAAFVAVLAAVYFALFRTGSDAADVVVVRAENGRIVFTSARNVGGDPFSTDIFIMNSDGSEARGLTSDGAHNADPSWAPDGKSIVFASRRDGANFAIFSMNVDGTNVRRLTNTAGDAR